MLAGGRMLSRRMCSAAAAAAAAAGSVPIALVKELRGATSAPISDCKKALEASGNDIEAAHGWLRKKGLADLEKKAGRLSVEGVVGIAPNRALPGAGGTLGVIAEVASETDFAAKTEPFAALVHDVLGAIADSAAVVCDAHADVARMELDAAAIEALPASASMSASLLSPDALVADVVGAAASSIRENLGPRRAAWLRAPPGGAVGAYTHRATSPGLGEVGVLVSLSAPDASEAHAEGLEALGRQIAMHVTASSPLYATRDKVPEDIVERERSFQAALALEQGKPEKIVEKMVAGKLQKFYKETVLVDQELISAESDCDTVGDLVREASQQMGVDVELSDFVCMRLGEELEGGDAAEAERA